MADPKLPGIYAIRNIINDKCYVGSAVRIARRWIVHRSDLKTGVHHCSPLQRAYNKHGIAAFTYEVLEVVRDTADLITREQYWIDKLKSHCDANGYNVRPRANSALGMKMPETAKLAIGLASRGKTLTAEHKAAISLVHKGKTISTAHRLRLSTMLKGRKHSPEHVAKIAAANRNRKRKMSAEQKRGVSLVHKGKTIAQHHRDAVSRATKARWMAFRLSRRPRGQLSLDI